MKCSPTQMWRSPRSGPRLASVLLAAATIALTEAQAAKWSGGELQPSIVAIL